MYSSQIWMNADKRMASPIFLTLSLWNLISIDVSPPQIRITDNLPVHLVLSHKSTSEFGGNIDYLTILLRQKKERINNVDVHHLFVISVFIRVLVDEEREKSVAMFCSFSHSCYLSHVT